MNSSSSNFSDFDQAMMQRALQLAENGRYSTAPNPAVGCVICLDEQVLAEGWHHQAGQPHAEREALNTAAAQGISVEGATVYVTLEPCSHTGRTSPCSDALIEAKVAKVLVAMQDPNPLVSGKGIQKLQAAGVQVDVGLEANAAQKLNQGFIKRMELKLPFVRLKVASSLDGHTAMANGESKWITGSEARKQVHFMRAQHGAIVTGIGTVLADDPSLNVRLSNEELASVNLTQETCHPIRIILDPHLSMPLNAKMLSLPGRTILMTSKCTAEDHSDLITQFYEKGAEVVAVAAEEDVLDIESVLHYLAEVEQVNEVMVESGAIVSGAFIKSGFVDEIHLFMAPSLMGEKTKPMFVLPGLETMEDKLQFKFMACHQVGEDMHLVLQPNTQTA